MGGDYGWLVNSSTLRFFVLLCVSIVMGSATSPIAAAKTPKGCGKESPNTAVVSKVLCPDGSPNSDIFKLLKRDMPKTMNLKKGASTKQISKAICADSGDARGPTVDNAVNYMFAWHEWKAGGLSYSAIMNAYYNNNGGDTRGWKTFCSSGSLQSNATTEGKLSNATGESWSRVLDGPKDLFPVTYTTGRFRLYMNSNRDCQAIEFEQTSDARRAAEAYGAYYAFGSIAVLYVSTLKIVVLDDSFGNSCSKGIRVVFGGSYY